MKKMKISQLELILSHSPRKNAPSPVELLLIFYFKNVQQIDTGAGFFHQLLFIYIKKNTIHKFFSSNETSEKRNSYIYI